MSAKDSIIEQAVKLNSELSVGIIPIAGGSKRPKEADWNNNARYGEEEIRELNPEDNYGVICEGITVIDFDPRNMDVRDPTDDNEVEWMIHLIREAHDLGDTFEVVTGGGGVHLYYRGETKSKKLANGVDVKSGRGHQVVGPGSVHPNTGKSYWVWRDDEMESLASTRLAVTSSASGASSPSSPSFDSENWESADIPEDGFGEGERNDGLYRHLCKYRAMGMGDKELEMYARVTNRLHVHPSLPESEVAKIVEQALKHTPGTMAMDTLMRDSIAALAKSGEPQGWIDRSGLREMKEPEYLVKGVLPSHGVGHLVGESYAGKTFVALDLALSLASSEIEKWMGHDAPGEHSVAYIAMEGGFDLGQRVDAWEELNGPVKDDNLRLLVEQDFDLMKPSALETLKEIESFNPSVLIIDTQSLAAPQADENDNSSMTALMSTVKLLSQAFGCLVILVHHAGYSADRARGASAQFANMDVSLYVKAGSSQDDLRTLKVTKLKSGRLPDDMKFRLVESGNSVVAQLETEAGTASEPDTLESCKNTQEKILWALRQDWASDGVSVARIADEVGRAKTTVRPEVSKLVESGEIVELVPADKGSNSAALYGLKSDDESDDD